MDFGAVENLDSADLSLPADHPDTLQLLSKKRKPEIFIGCAKWGRKDWIGKIYPSGTKDKDFLDQYVKNFNSVELNATFHRIPPASTIDVWSKTAGNSNFIFCPKFPKVISHSASLESKLAATKHFIDTTSVFGKHLGPSFLQLPPSFSIQKFPALESFLGSISHEINLFIEFRHPSWFISSKEADLAFEFFRKNKIGVLITDTAGERNLIHMRLSKPEAFIRFVGYGLHATDFKRIDDWAERIEKWLDGGLQRLYFFLHNDSDENEKYSPELAAYAIDAINKRCNQNLALPNLIDKGNSQDLFNN